MCYYHVVDAFDMATSVRIVPLLPDLDSSNRYTAFKTFLVDTYGLSEDQWVKHFLAIMDLGVTLAL